MSEASQSSKVNYDQQLPQHDYSFHRFRIACDIQSTMEILAVKAQAPHKYPVLAAVWPQLRREMRHMQEEYFDEQFEAFHSSSSYAHNYPLSARLRAWIDSITGLNRKLKAKRNAESTEE